MTIQSGEFQATLSKAYTRLNYEQFCEVIGETPYFNGGVSNVYAEEKWSEFQKLVSSTNKLGTFLDKLLDWSQNA